MDEREHHETLRREFETPRPASSTPALVAAGLGAVLVILFGIMLWPRGDAPNTAVTDGSPKTGRTPTPPPGAKPPTDMQPVIPKAPAQ